MWSVILDLVGFIVMTLDETLVNRTIVGSLPDLLEWVRPVGVFSSLETCLGTGDETLIRKWCYRPHQYCSNVRRMFIRFRSRTVR